MKQKTLLHSYRNTNNKIANSSNSCCSFCFYIVHVMKFEIQVLCLLVFSTKNKQLQQIGESWSVNKFVIKYFVKILLFGNTASLMWIFSFASKKSHMQSYYYQRIKPTVQEMRLTEFTRLIICFLQFQTRYLTKV